MLILPSVLDGNPNEEIPMTDQDKNDCDDDRLKKAEADLKKGEAELKQAERDIEHAEAEIEEAERDRVEVHVVHVNDVQKTHFKESVKKTLQQVWDRSYKELEIEKKPKDIFQTDDKKPKSLMPYLGLTLKDAHEQKVITDYRFGIVSESGGA
jgi:hypothetical protein